MIPNQYNQYQNLKALEMYITVLHDNHVKADFPSGHFITQAEMEELMEMEKSYCLSIS